MRASELLNIVLLDLAHSGSERGTAEMFKYFSRDETDRTYRQRVAVPVSTTCRYNNRAQVCSLFHQ